jgi:hypothetical protein
MWEPSRERRIGLSSWGFFGLDWGHYQPELAQKWLKKGQKRGVVFTSKLSARFCKLFIYMWLH